MSDRNQVSTYLVMRLGDEPERAIIWDTLDISVGRLDSQDIEVSEPEVSRQHAILKHKEGAFSIEDLGTSLGTLVNGEPIERHALQHGDVIQIGGLELRFGQTTKRIQPGPNVTFASVLKGGSLPALDGDMSGKTMLGFDVQDDLLAAAPAAAKHAGPHAVAADGTLEELGESGFFELGLEGMDLGAPAEPRDLDKELAERPADWAAAPTTAARLATDSAGGASSGEFAREIVLSIDGPAEDVEGLLNLIGDEPIRIGSLRLRIARRG